MNEHLRQLTHYRAVQARLGIGTKPNIDLDPEADLRLVTAKRLAAADRETLEQYIQDAKMARAADMEWRQRRAEKMRRNRALKKAAQQEATP